MFIVSNEDKGVDGYAEVSAVAHLLSPHTRVNATQLWNTTHASYRIQNGGKNFIHAIAISKHLASVPENDSSTYKSLRQLVRDLLVGDQKAVDDELKTELTEIKKSLVDMEAKLSQENNTLSDFNGLLRVLKSELISELKGSDAVAPVGDLLHME